MPEGSDRRFWRDPAALRIAWRGGIGRYKALGERAGTPAPVRGLHFLVVMQALDAIASRAQPIEIFDTRLVGLSAESGRKLVVTLGLIALVLLARSVLRWIVNTAMRSTRLARARFWARQAISLIAALVLVIGLLSIWFDDPSRLATAIGLVTAGLAFALQKVVTALAGYIVIIRGKTFGVGDRIVMGGVRGDVVALDFTQTTIMEMGQPPPVQRDDPAMWIKSRQYTGRIVTVSNARVFDTPVYNYTREFPYLWGELTIRTPYEVDRDRVERLLLDIAERHTATLQQLGDEDRRELARRYLMRDSSVTPRVYFRIDERALEIALRFIARDHGLRELEDAMVRDILQGLEQAGIPLASPMLELTGIPRIHVVHDDPPHEADLRATHH
jgi:small-conductance mechanosensitive channel